jgi:hypothetical protein
LAGHVERWVKNVQGPTHTLSHICRLESNTATEKEEETQKQEQKQEEDMQEEDEHDPTGGG